MHLEDPAFLGLGEQVDPVAQHRFGERELDHARHHGQLVERRDAGGVELAQPAAHRVGDAGRQRVRTGGEHLGQEERVAPGEGVQGGAVVPRAPGEVRDRRAGQRTQRQPHDTRAGEGPEELTRRGTGARPPGPSAAGGRAASRSAARDSAGRRGWRRRPSARPRGPAPSVARAPRARRRPRRTRRPPGPAPPAPARAGRCRPAPPPATAPAGAARAGRRTRRAGCGPAVRAGPGAPGPRWSCRCPPRPARPRPVRTPPRRRRPPRASRPARPCARAGPPTRAESSHAGHRACRKMSVAATEAVPTSLALQLPA